MIRLKECPSNGNPHSFVTIHHGIGGWNFSLWRWAGDEGEADGFPGYEPWGTGFTNTSLGTGNRADAVREAEGWARNEELPVWIPPEDTEDSPQ